MCAFRCKILCSLQIMNNPFDCHDLEVPFVVVKFSIRGLQIGFVESSWDVYRKNDINLSVIN